MKLCERLTLGIFQLGCFGLAGYLVFVQLKTYFANEDLSTIAYKNFQNEGQDIFPTFSICAVGGSWILEDRKMPKNLSTDIYMNILSGIRPEKLNYSELQFEDVTIDLNKFITDSYTLTDKGKRIIRSKGSVHGKQNSNSSLQISHLAPNRICVTKNDFQKNALVEKDYIEMNMIGMSSFRLRNGFLDLDLYIHQKEQLLRSLKHPSYHLDKRDIKHLKEKQEKSRRNPLKQEIKLRIVYVDVLRKRKNSNLPCDPELQNEDNKIRHSIIDAVGCIPAFSRLFLNDTLLLNKSAIYSTCSRTQYRRINKLYTNFLKTKEWYTQPCSRMNTIVTTASSITKTEPLLTDLFLTSLKPSFTIEFTVEYLTGSYRETINKLDFDMATLWSQIGGFIGIFLGYSLLQVPELVGNGLRILKSFLPSH